MKYFRLGGEAWYPAYGLQHEIMVSSYGNQSKCLRNLGRLNEALECNDKCLKVLANTDDEDSYDYAITSFNKAILFEITVRMEHAKEACLKSIEVLNGDRIRNDARSLALMERCKVFMDELSNN